jgi:hypothetical protein
MVYFWGVFLYLFKQAILVIPSPGTSRRSSVPNVKRRASSYSVEHQPININRLSLESLNKNSKKLMTERRKQRKEELKIKGLEESPKTPVETNNPDDYFGFKF